MNNFIKISSSIFFVLFITSCQKDNDDLRVEDTSYFPSLINDYDTSDNTLTFVINYDENNFGSASVVYNNISNPNNKIEINDNLFDFDTVEGQRIEINQVTTPESLNTIYPGIKRIDLNNLEEEFEMYNPSPVLVDLNQNLLEASKSQGLNLSWEMDEGSTNNIIFLSIIDRGNVDEGELLEGNEAQSIKISDNGNYNIPSEDLASFSTGNRLDIFISRANAYSTEENHVVFYNTNYIEAIVVE